MSETLLIVSADDFGLTPGVCDGILRSHRDGIVTSTSVLATGQALPGFTPALRDSGLDVGVHLAAVGEERPVLTSKEIPTLVDRNGQFALTWRQFVAKSMAGHIDYGDLYREFTAQLEVIRATGLQPTHLDSHQHLHLWPSVGRTVLRVAVTNGIRAVRAPRTRHWGPSGLGVRFLAKRFEKKVQRLAIKRPIWFRGLDEAGSMDSILLARTLNELGSEQPPSAEITVHPGSSYDPDRSRYNWGYRWTEEESALCDKSIKNLVEQLPLRFGTFSDLVGNTSELPL